MHYRHLGLCHYKEQHSLGSMSKEPKTLLREVSLSKATSSLGQILSNVYTWEKRIFIFSKSQYIFKQNDRQKSQISAQIYSLEDHGSYNCMKNLKSIHYKKTCVSHMVLHLEPCSMGHCPPLGRPERADKLPSMYSEKPVVKSNIVNRK